MTLSPNGFVLGNQPPEQLDVKPVTSVAGESQMTADLQKLLNSDQGQQQQQQQQQQQDFNPAAATYQQQQQQGSAVDQQQAGAMSNLTAFLNQAGAEGLAPTGADSSLTNLVLESGTSNGLIEQIDIDNFIRHLGNAHLLQAISPQLGTRSTT